MVQQVKNLALSPQWLGLLLWCRFDPWPWNFHMSWAWPRKKKKIEGEKASELDMSPDLNFAFYRNDLGQVI